MDISSLHLILATAISLLAPFILLLLKICTGPKRAENLPPGPKKLPLIGNLHQMGSLPFRSLRDLSRQHGPIMHLMLGQVPAIVVSSPALTKQFLKDNDPCFADRPQSIVVEIMWYNYSNLAFSPYGDYWRQMRKICILELLSAKNVRSFASIRAEEMARILQSIRASAGKPVNLTDKVFSLISSITCRAAFGKVCKDKDGLVGLLRSGLKLADGLVVADLYPSSRVVRALSWSRRRLVAMRRKIDTILDEIIREHEENLKKMKSDLGERRGNGEFGNEDLVDVLSRVMESGEIQFPIGNDNIKAVILDMFSAGTETSSSLIDWTMAELMRNPRVMAKAQAEIRQAFQGKDQEFDEHDVTHKLKYLKLVIKESMRLHPPVPILPRASREERVIGGYTIPAKVRVMVNTWAMQRDPECWKDPESFVPERFEEGGPDFVGGDFEYLPFGTGRRMCPGMTFGLASVELPVAWLLYSFDWKLPEGVREEDLDMIENPGITASRKEELFVVPTPYQPS
ncbi:Cytochrome P450 71B34 [Striga hermonthica]|uniref:Cytochrome P450 71B34 n=1 Tax=Striga hermonthica TaxID=68872 RepID=A0A9N7NL39_STRHE|nr:Cytochrome P450 71B34 [Striga hermonthica]